LLNSFALIKEDFLHYLWKHKLFDARQLVSSSNENIQILNSGMHNFNAGPDFFNAKIKIDNQVWAGNVEIHIKSSDWYVHNHEVDKAYDSIVLHVVWENDMPIYRKNNTTITTLVLQDYVSKEMLDSYYKLFFRKENWINCEKNIATIDAFTFNNWKERLYLERLNDKSEVILSLLKHSKNDWEVVLFKLLAKNFGLKVNGESFFNLANSFEFSVFRKQKSNLQLLEALLFGQASFFDVDFDEPYFNLLKNEYAFLQVKYKLKPIHKSEVKFFRLRPNNFPTIRLSQLANLYFNKPNLFSKIMAVKTIEDYYDLFTVTTSEFWETHYSFKTSTKKQIKKTTKSFIDLLLINTIIPLRFVYEKHIGKLNEEKIIALIQQIKPEKNGVIDKFKALQITSKNALETQALIQLKTKYCTPKKCLQCVVGISLIKM